MSEREFTIVLKVMADRIELLEYQLKESEESRKNLVRTLEEYKKAEASNG